MMDNLVKQFVGSSLGQQAVQQLTGQGLSADQANKAVEATAQGTAEQVGSGGAQGLFGGLGGGAGAPQGGTATGGGGGGGLGGLVGSLGGLFGGGKSATTAAGGLPPQIVDRIAGEVANRAGLDPGMARMAVNAVLPKVL